MGLDLGWYDGDARETIWKDDTALGPVPPDVIKAWAEDGDANHLRPYVKAGERATVFTFRSLSIREKAHVEGYWLSGAYRVWTEAFLIGVEFPGRAEPDKLESGVLADRYVRDNGIRMLNEKFAQGIERRNPGISRFYGRLITGATFLSEAEKKALSPSSTETPSSEADSTKDDTAVSGNQGEAAV